jgi:LiaF transmembrane domain
LDRKQASQVTTGALMVALGLLLLADRLGAGPGWDFGRLWPVILLALGVARLLVPRDDGSRGGLWLIFLGVLFLLNNYRVMTLDQSWPLFIVVAGLAILFGGRRHPRQEH